MPTRALRRSLRVVAAAIVTMLAACSSSGTTTTAGPSVVGHTYVSTKVTGHTMPAGTSVTLGFGADGKLSANAGCNSLGGSYLVDRGRLVAGPLDITLMGCAPSARQAQDQWLAALLKARPRLDLSGRTLRLSIGATTIELAES